MKVRGWVPLAIGAGSVALLITAWLAQDDPHARTPRKRGSASAGIEGSTPKEIASMKGDRVRAYRERDQLLSLPDDELRSLVNSPEWTGRVRRCIDSIPAEEIQGERASLGLAEFFGPLNERIHKLQTQGN